MSAGSFSLDGLRMAKKVDQAIVQMIPASDGIPLAYRKYSLGSPDAAVLFYHGGGAHSGAGYQFLGNGLQSRFNTTVILPDIRGHGASGGPRGDAPTPKQVWDDISIFIKMLRDEYPHLPLYLGGHSSGAGLILNYLSQPDHEPADGYLFLSPQLGQQAQIDRPTIAAPFARVDGSTFAAYFRSAGTEHGHDYAVQFNYPPDVLKADPGLVAAITVTVSLATVPYAPQHQFASLDRPFGLWIGAEDELFLPDRVLAFADYAMPAIRAGSEALMIPDARHLSILVNAHETIGAWISQR